MSSKCTTCRRRLTRPELASAPWRPQTARLISQFHFYLENNQTLYYIRVNRHCPAAARIPKARQLFWSVSLPANYRALYQQRTVFLLGNNNHVAPKGNELLNPSVGFPGSSLRPYKDLRIH